MEVILTECTVNPVHSIERAAANCYDSSPDDNGKIMNSCYNSGHHSVLEFADFTFHISGVSRACYDDQTEILTRSGWKLFKDVTDGEEVLTIRKDGKAEFQQILNKTAYHYDGMMHKYKSQNVDLMITPNHNIYMRKYDIRTRSEYSLVPSEDVSVNRFYMQKVVDYNPLVTQQIVIKGYSYTRKNNQGNLYLKTTNDLVLNRENFYKLLAWYLSDGSVYFNKNENSYTISITQLDQKNIPVIKQIVTDNGFKCCYDGKAVKFKSLTLGKYFYDIGKSNSKKIPFNIFENFDQNLAKIFIDEYLKGDGTIDKNNCGKLFTTSHDLAEQLYSLCFVAGYTATQHTDDRVGESHIWNEQKISHNHKCYVINISMNGKRNYEIVIKKDKHFSEQYYNGMVYCVEVPNHTLFIRRNKIALWCGNCTHQLVRHRHASYAQRSQRYVTEDGFKYVMPPSVGSKGLVNAYERIMNEINSMYNFLIENGVPQEDARYMLPNACETVIEVKMNGRELIHFCNERLCTRAQWEIRELAKKMKACVAEHNDECKKFSNFLVPKCQKNLGYPFCTEHKSCGLAPKLSDVYRIYVSEMSKPLSGGEWYE